VCLTPPSVRERQDALEIEVGYCFADCTLTISACVYVISI
jgi:hypothetical protein